MHWRLTSSPQTRAGRDVPRRGALVHAGAGRRRGAGGHQTAAHHARTGVYLDARSVDAFTCRLLASAGRYANQPHPRGITILVPTGAAAAAPGTSVSPHDLSPVVHAPAPAPIAPLMTSRRHAPACSSLCSSRNTKWAPSFGSCRPPTDTNEEGAVATPPTLRHRAGHQRDAAPTSATPAATSGTQRPVRADFDSQPRSRSRKRSGHHIENGPCHDHRIRRRGNEVKRQLKTVYAPRAAAEPPPASEPGRHFARRLDDSRNDLCREARCCTFGPDISSLDLEEAEACHVDVASYI
jgi:hypothetical protein